MLQATEPLQRGEIEGRPAWLLSTRNTAVLLCLSADDALLLPYWGPHGQAAHWGDYMLHPQGNRPSLRAFLDGQPVAYPVYGDPLFKEVCLVVARANGSRDTRLSFVEDRAFEIDGHPALDLMFQDQPVGLRVTQRFQVFPEHDVVARSVMVTNGGSEVLTLERALSAALPLPPGEYDAWTLHGQWGREFGLYQRPLAPGSLVLESRRGLS